MAVRVVSALFDPAVEMGAFAAKNARSGAVASFLGHVRDEAGAVEAMTLEHYPGMTEKELTCRETEARQRWDLADVLILHRVGRLLPGEPIVLVQCASAHRKDALEACTFLIDTLKTSAPFWKQEERHDGARWVEAKPEDAARAKEWD
ncbi:MAG: molybdenum cofactor biosynthesis protein MoaE [Alphaproteobacteria bacterium RIFOXYD12_FULL_60_8]|nr:MAG: molybdenum cofactor biosynthesis protein MoaE [Alphaproteobacteria bacterium RIFOXYD12_FULL_60_8]